MESLTTRAGPRSTPTELEHTPVRARPANAARGLPTLLVLLGGLLSCAPRLQAIPLDPGVDFAAHAAHRGLVVDEMPGASPAVLVPAGWQSWTGGPRFLLQAHNKTIAALWFAQPGKIIVRQRANRHAPLIGEVDATWRESAIRLTFKPANGSPLQTGAFDRIDGRVVTAALGPQVDTILDVRGVYRAELRDAQGAPAGWLRVEISPHQAAPHMYDGVLPPSVNGPLATAAVALLDSDVNSIEDHAVNVYIGN
jgi:hypothetical protein